MEEDLGNPWEGAMTKLPLRPMGRSNKVNRSI